MTETQGNDYAVEMHDFNQPDENVDFQNIRAVQPLNKKKMIIMKVTIAIIITAAILVMIAGIGAIVYVYDVAYIPKPVCKGFINKEEWATVERHCPSFNESTIDEPCMENTEKFNLTTKVVRAIYDALDQIHFRHCKQYKIVVTHNCTEIGICDGVYIFVYEDILVLKQRHTHQDVIPEDESKRIVFEMDAIDIEHGGMLRKMIEFFDYIKITDGVTYVNQEKNCVYSY